MPEFSQETQVALMEQDLQRLLGRVEHNESEIEKLKQERHNLLVWGIVALGALVTSLASFIVMGVKGLRG